MAKKKSRRHRGPREHRPAPVPQPQQEAGGSTQASAAPLQSGATAPRAAAIAPRAAISRPTSNSSHNLGLELKMIALLGGGAIIILGLLSMVQPTTAVANWLHL